MAYFPPEVILEAKKIDVLTYLKATDPEQLVRCSRTTYCTREHDSLKISNGKWMWFSRGIGGASALDYLIKVEGLTFIEAMERLTRCNNLPLPDLHSHSEYRKPDTSKPLLLPAENNNHDVIKRYLISRGIDEEIIDDCIEKKLIFESLPYHNIVFVGYDEHSVARFATFRACNQSRIMGDCSGSRKDYSFRIEGTNKKEIHLFESAIDLLSYATLQKLDGKDWKELNLLSLSGVYAPKDNYAHSMMPIALKKFLENNQQVKRIVLHLDNDLAGRKATKTLYELLKNDLEVVDEHPLIGKDVNDFLCMKRNLNTTKKRSFER